MTIPVNEARISQISQLTGYIAQTEGEQMYFVLNRGKLVELERQYVRIS